MTNMPELLPCPFCGCTTIKRQDQGDLHWYECDWCQATGPTEPATDDYPESWNTRAAGAERDALRAEVERLRDPAAVHINMLRGTIAAPSLAQIIHIFGEEAIRAALGEEIR